MVKWLDTGLPAKERAAALLAEMSLDEKMGQVIGFIYFGGEPQGFERFCPHGVGEISTLGMRMLESLEECVEIQHKIQRRVMELSEHGIPAIFHMEAVCGALLQGALSFPCSMGRGCGWDPELEEKIGAIVGRQERSLAITHSFAPVLDLARDPRLGRHAEAYGEDPTLISSLGAAFTRGVQGGITAGLRSEAVAKHFTAFHASAGGIHGAHTEAGSRTIRELYSKGFQAAISESGLRGVMPCYCSINGEPISISRDLLQGLLRGEMEFDGLLVSDYSALNNAFTVDKIGESAADVGLMGMKAGMDLELPIMQCYNDELKARFADGTADIAILDTLVARVLEAKFRMGIFERPFSLSCEELKKSFFCASDREITQRSARQSLVLLKNNGVLPINGDIKKIALIGCHAATARSMFGGYTHFSMAEGMYAARASMAGVKGSNDKVEMNCFPGSQVQRDDIVPQELVGRIAPSAKSLLDQLREVLPDAEISYAYGYPYAGNDSSGYEQALKLAESAELVILALGGKHGTSSIASTGEGIDSTSINLPPCQEEFIRLLSKLGRPSIGVHFDGRPISSDAADECLDAIIEAWSPAEAGAEAIAAVLTGRYNPDGKLSVSVARSSGQIPVYYNHPNGSCWHQGESIGFADYVDMTHLPRYCFGHGLSYTSFTYNNLQISDAATAPDGIVKIYADITNGGKVSGTEVVQLYISDRSSSMTRPCMELQGFCRVGLLPGERKTVCFELRADQCAFLDADMRWKVEAGAMDVLVGASSQDIRLKGEFAINADKYINGARRGFCARAHVL